MDILENVIVLFNLVMLGMIGADSEKSSIKHFEL